MRTPDLPAVAAIAAAIHPDHFERDAVFLERLTLCPEGCHSLVADGTVAGYIFSHPWQALRPPALDTFLGALPAVPATYYIHDIALLPPARGHGAARAAIAAAERRAQRLRLADLSLVTVEEAAAFWRKAGFADTPAADDAAVATYGARALFMTRQVAIA